MTLSFGIVESNMGLLPYGPLWRRARRELLANLSPADLESYQPIERRAIHCLLRNLLSFPDNFEQHLRHLTGQVIMSVAYGIDVLPENDPYVADSEKMLQALAIGSTPEAALLDAIPWLIKMPSWPPGARFKRYAREWYPIAVGSRKTPIDKVKRELAAGAATPSVATKTVSNLHENSTEEDKWVAEAVPGTTYVASVDTTLILAMTLYPEIQRKIVGNSHLPDFSDEDALPYVQAVLKEVLRWHPVAPLGVPHRVTESDTYEGYHIPAGSTIIPNAWCVYHDIQALYTSAQPQ
ncbi:Cytochrome P450 [Lactarius tabidus]